MAIDRSTIEGIKVSKSGNVYVQNDAFLKELIISKEQDQLTDKAIEMMTLISENIATKKMHYNNPDDRDDCIAGGIMDSLLYWRSFDPTKTENAFGYFTSVITNGIAKTWRKLGKKYFPDRLMVSLDNENIHSL